MSEPRYYAPITREEAIREMEAVTRERNRLRDQLRKLEATTRPVVGRLWWTGTSQPAEVQHAAEVIDHTRALLEGVNVREVLGVLNEWEEHA